MVHLRFVISPVVGGSVNQAHAVSKGSFDKLFFLLVFVLEGRRSINELAKGASAGPKKNGGVGKAVHGGRFHGYACREVLSEKFQVSTEAFATDVQSCRHPVATGDGEHLPGLVSRFRNIGMDAETSGARRWVSIR